MTPWRITVTHAIRSCANDFSASTRSSPSFAPIPSEGAEIVTILKQFDSRGSGRHGRHGPRLRGVELGLFGASVGRGPGISAHPTRPQQALRWQGHFLRGGAASRTAIAAQARPRPPVGPVPLASMVGRGAVEARWSKSASRQRGGTALLRSLRRYAGQAGGTPPSDLGLAMCSNSVAAATRTPTELERRAVKIP